MFTFDALIDFTRRHNDVEFELNIEKNYNYVIIYSISEDTNDRYFLKRAVTESLIPIFSKLLKKWYGEKYRVTFISKEEYDNTQDKDFLFTLPIGRKRYLFSEGRPYIF